MLVFMGSFGVWAQVWSKGSRVDKVMLLHAKGDSMIGVGINDGDLIVATITNCADDGEIVVALINCRRQYLLRVLHKTF